MPLVSLGLGVSLSLVVGPCQGGRAEPQEEPSKGRGPSWVYNHSSLGSGLLQAFVEWGWLC